jgi:hypothetical protein
VLLLSGPGEVSGARDRAEIPQLVEFHLLALLAETPAAKPVAKPAATRDAAMSFSYEFHSFHILDLGFAILLLSISGGTNNDG